MVASYFSEPPLQNSEPSVWDRAACIALEKLEERGSLEILDDASRSRLEPLIVKWLYWAESHHGSEIVYKTNTGLVKGIPLNSFLNFPEHYEAHIQQGAFISLELQDGRSLVFYLYPFHRENPYARIEAIQRQYPLASERPL